MDDIKIKEYTERQVKYFEKMRDEKLIELKENILKGNSTTIEDFYGIIDLKTYLEDVVRFSNHYRRIYGEKINEYLNKDLEDLEMQILKVLYYITLSQKNK